MATYPLGGSPSTTSEPVALAFDTIKLVAALQNVEKTIQQTNKLSPVVHEYKNLLVNVLAQSAYGDPVAKYSECDSNIKAMTANIQALSVAYQALGANLITLA